MDNIRVFNPPKSVQGFLRSENFISLIVGPIGSTKTTAGLMKIAYHAKRMAKCIDGIRRSKCIWVRNTREQLKDTSMPDFLKWYPDGRAGNMLKSEMRFVMRFDDVECEVLFRGLDDADDVRRVLSMQASFAVLDEFREIHPEIYEALQGRLGRYPDGTMVPHRSEWGFDDNGNPIEGCVTDDGRPNKHLWGMTNPPDAETYWEEHLTNPPATVDVFFQPDALSPEADWVHLLPSNYYEDLAEGKTQEWIDVYIRAKFGRSLAGKPVHSAFLRDKHVAKMPLFWVRSSTCPIVVGVDHGLHPAAIFGQLLPSGRMIVLSALYKEGMGALRFVQEVIKPHLASKFAGAKVIFIGDPAGKQRVQTDEKTMRDIFTAQGLQYHYARTNDPSSRISAVDSFLTRMIDGEPAYLTDPKDCVLLNQALGGRYRYKINTKNDNSPADEPDKTHPWSDLGDANQYMCLHADGGSTFGFSMNQRRDVKSVSAAGWT